MEFTDIKLEDKTAIEQFLKIKNSNSCQLCFANLYCLKDKYGTQISIFDETLFIRQTRRFENNIISYFLPIGTKPVHESIEHILYHVHNNNENFCFYPVFSDETIYIENILENNFELKNYGGWSEYIYDTKTIYELSGRSFSKIRRGIQQFNSLYANQFSVENISHDNISEILQYQNKWLDLHSDNLAVKDSLMAENNAIILALSHFFELELEGIILKIDNEIVGYCYGCIIGNDTFDVIAQKCDTQYRHIYKAIFHETIATYIDRLSYTNMEEDLGLPGLIQMKTSYKPIKMLDKYIVSKIL